MIIPTIIFRYLKNMEYIIERKTIHKLRKLTEKKKNSLRIATYEIIKTKIFVSFILFYRNKTKSIKKTK